VAVVCWFGLPPLLARRLAGLPALNFQTEPLVMVIAGIGGKPLFTAETFLETMLELHPQCLQAAGKSIPTRSGQRSQISGQWHWAYLDRRPYRAIPLFMF
jgi:hypothetical protein